MMPLEIMRAEVEGQINVEGDLTFATINQKMVEKIDFKQYQQSGRAININFSRVSKSDSAGLALIVEWIKFSKFYKVQLNFNQLPEQLLTLAELSGFADNEYFNK